MYDRHPVIEVGDESDCLIGWADISQAISTRSGAICVECYPGAFLEEIENGLAIAMPDIQVIRSADAFLSSSELERKYASELSDDPVFGVMARAELHDFFDEEKVAKLRAQTGRTSTVVILGVGASVVCPNPDVLIYVDLARWELQLRQRRNAIANLGLSNHQECASAKYKRAFFLDWRAADRQKRRLLSKIDYLLDTNTPGEPKLITGRVLRSSLESAASRPFRLVPFFDPGPWGGHWMEEVCNLPADGAPNHAWCFDCVPEENSLLLAFGEKHVEVPALDLVFACPEKLLGRDVHARFGDEFPIRFDLLDTMGGGNLSLQVHPLTSYIREHFGMAYTQDESYYLLDAGDEACVYLGLKQRLDRKAFEEHLRLAEKQKVHFPADRYVNKFVAKKHDHFLIPAGTVHCSGRNCVVLEISATPYIFTFKLWDWGRSGLDGLPRPIHLRHGLANIQWDRTTEWVEESLINRIEPMSCGSGWREERTGLHPLEFIETRRYWFTSTVAHDTEGTVHVLNLVEGEQVSVESPKGRFPPLVVNYAETFIVPAAVGPYTIRPVRNETNREYATIQARVRKAQ